MKKKLFRMKKSQHDSQSVPKILGDLSLVVLPTVYLQKKVEKEWWCLNSGIRSSKLCYTLFIVKQSYRYSPASVLLKTLQISVANFAQMPINIFCLKLQSTTVKFSFMIFLDKRKTVSPVLYCHDVHKCS